MRGERSPMLAVPLLKPSDQVAYASTLSSGRYSSPISGESCVKRSTSFLRGSYTAAGSAGAATPKWFVTWRRSALRRPPSLSASWSVSSYVKLPKAA